MRRNLFVFKTLWIVAVVLSGVQARGQAVDDDTPSLVRRLEAAEARILELERGQRSDDASPPDVPTAHLGQHPRESRPVVPDWTVGYDSGFFIRPADEESNPFELRVNGRMQFRHTGFARDITEWTDNAGVVRPVTNRNDFEIERGRLEFRGFFRDPNLQFFINLDSDTDDGHVVIFHDFWTNYKFNEAFDLHFGKAYVPGCRDWLNGSLRTRFTDRSMATTFFRPDRTLGIWALGEPSDKLFYRCMIGNGFNTSDLVPEQIDTRLVYAGSTWKDFGDYGQGYSDLEWHSAPAAQIGHSFTFAGSDGRDAVGRPLAEETFVRLSDGTRLTEVGALAPGVSVDHFDIYLYTADAAFKYRGFSFNVEYFLRWLQSLRGDGPLPVSRLFDHGYYAEAGYFLIRGKLELNGRISQVFGEFGNAQEYAGGVNWLINGTHNLKLTLDVTKLNHNPAGNTGPNLRPGDDGILVRTQLQAAF
jgi:hypothetical protein